MTTVDSSFVGTRVAGVTALQIGDELLLWGDRWRYPLHLDATAALIWQFFDGESSLGEIAADVASVFGVATNNVITDITPTVDQLVSEAFLSTGPDTSAPTALEDRWLRSPELSNGAKRALRWPDAHMAVHPSGIRVATNVASNELSFLDLTGTQWTEPPRFTVTEQSSGVVLYDDRARPLAIEPDLPAVLKILQLHLENLTAMTQRGDLVWMPLTPIALSDGRLTLVQPEFLIAFPALAAVCERAKATILPVSYVGLSPDGTCVIPDGYRDVRHIVFGFSNGLVEPPRTSADWVWLACLQAATGPDVRPFDADLCLATMGALLTRTQCVATAGWGPTSLVPTLLSTQS